MVEHFEYVDQMKFEERVGALQAGGWNDFPGAFDRMRDLVAEDRFDDYTVLFMTDGQIEHG